MITSSENQSVGLLIILIGILANAGSSIIGRDINKRREISQLVVTFISMGTGAIILISIGISMNGVPVMESSIINGTMLIQIALLAAYFLGENLSFQKVIGMIIAGGGAVLVQIKKGISVSKG